MIDRSRCGAIAVVGVLLAGCRSSEPPPAPAATDPARPAAGSGSAAPASAGSGSAACLDQAAVLAKHVPEPDLEPCTHALEHDLDGDGLPELAVACPIATAERAYTVYRQSPRGCFGELAAFTGAGWSVLPATIAGHRAISVWQPPSRNAGDLVDQQQAYDPATRRYRAGAAAREPGPDAPRVELPKAFHRISGLLGIAVGQPGATAAPECCLDCEPLIPELRALNALSATLAGKVGPAELRAAADRVRSSPWPTLLAGTAYQDKTRKRFVDAVVTLAARLDAVADALDQRRPSAKRVEQLAAAVTKLIAASGELGDESTHYCSED